MGKIPLSGPLPTARTFPWSPPASTPAVSTILLSEAATCTCRSIRITRSPSPWFGPTNGTRPSSAVAGGWAAIEALLTGPGDHERVHAADRMASIVACSFARAELTSLSYQLEEQGDAIGDQLRNCASNRDRCEVLAKLIQAGNPPRFPKDSDSAALARITSLLREPWRVLRDVENHISTCFRRLYRHRNIVLHGGKTDAIGLRSCLRNAAPLVGAGLDRVAHGWFVDRIHPLELAARARVRLDALGTGSRTSALDLLSQ